jgi:hypothetical protein
MLMAATNKCLAQINKTAGGERADIGKRPRVGSGHDQKDHVGTNLQPLSNHNALDATFSPPAKATVGCSQALFLI